MISQSFSDPFVLFVKGLAACLLLVSCTTVEWSEKADAEVAGILSQKQKELFGEEVEFDIETPYSDSDPNEIEAIAIIHSRKSASTKRIDLNEALDLAVLHKREYQLEKENLYLAGLALTGARHDFRPHFGAGSQASLDTFTQRAGGGNPRQTDQQGSLKTRAGFDQLFRSGGTLAVDVAQDIFRFYLGGGGAPSTRLLAAGLTQPLLRGRGAVVRENLTQRERDVSYEIRSFSRFQQQTALDVITDYCRILQEKDRVRNEYSNYRNLIAFTERATELAKDRLPRFQVDQAKQDELRARNRYIVAVNSYRNRIDQFKLSLGLPIGDDVMIDDSVLRALEAAGLPGVPLDADDALALAVESRLDFLNEIDRFEDSKRKLEVAADAFKPGLNLFVNAELTSRGKNGRTSYSNFDPDAYRTRFGVDLDLPLDNMEARNSFRRAEINFERQLRQLSFGLDRIHSDLRSGLRGLELARQTFEIQQNALELANRRVEASNLLLEADRAETRDLLEARNDQLSARNAMTSALIDYHLTRLNFLHNLGKLQPESQELWTQTPKSKDIRNFSRPTSVDTPKQGLISPEELFQEPSLETES